MGQQQLIPQNKGVVAPSSASEMGVVTATPVEDTVAELKDMLGMVSVVYGDQRKHFDVAGETVADIRRSLQAAFGIDSAAVPHIDGEPTGANTVLQRHQELEFIKPSGDKGYF